MQEVIDTAAKVVSADGKTIKVLEGERRAGDPAILVAESTRAQAVLNWQPQFAELETIIQHAWQWELKLAKHDYP